MSEDVAEDKINNSRTCGRCHTLHKCSRCTKTTHICCTCGNMTHDCDICGVILDSMTAIKRHQEESQICKKARMMTATTFLEQVKKAGGVITNMNNHKRNKSVPDLGLMANVDISV